MQRKWVIIIIIIVLVVLMGNSTKKEGKFSFRCSEDKKSIEMFNRMDDKNKFDIYQDCGEGTCQLQGGSPACIIKESKKEEASAFNPTMLIMAAIALFIFLKNRRRILK